ncbi:MAG: hypothetical protein VW362_12215 [Candidatus Nanopelagicales bacterium]
MTDFRYRPVGGRVVVVRDEADDISPGGILLPSTANKDVPLTGTVIACDAEHEDCPDVYNGATVVFRKYAGTEFKVGETVYLVLSPDEIMLVA